MKKHPMRLWLDAATDKERHKLARLARLSETTLYHIAGRQRSASNVTAIRLEKAGARLARAGLPVLVREDFNDGCRNCDFLKRCRNLEAI